MRCWLFVACVLIASAVVPVSASGPKVTTKDGVVVGLTEDDVNLFLGIPFAAPPVGTNRFKPPQPVTPWKEERLAWLPGQSCYQLHLYKNIRLGSEDCLYLNVHYPASHNPETDPPLPVMVWMYGGAFIMGSAMEFGWYDPKNMVKHHNVVVVGMNYRLGALGFLANDHLLKESGTTGNYGLQDQRAAMRWVQQNIALFGGDPKQVTIFGESAGAFSVCSHLASPDSAGLFSHAIMESGSCDRNSFAYASLPDATSFGNMFSLYLGCNSSALSASDYLSCMRALPVASVVTDIPSWSSPNWPWNKTTPRPKGFFVPQGAPLMAWTPTVDGSPQGLPDEPLWLLQQGKFNKAELIIGTNNNEGTIFTPMVVVLVPGVSLPLNKSSFMLSLHRFFNESAAPKVAAMYPVAKFNNSYDSALSEILRDVIFTCPSRRAALAVQQSNVSTHMYHFHYKLDWNGTAGLGDYHTSELFFVWDNPFPFWNKFTSNDTAMSSIMQTFWTNFAKSGDPNKPTSLPSGAVPWPQYDSASRQDIVLKLPCETETHFNAAICDVLDTISLKKLYS